MSRPLILAAAATAVALFAAGCSSARPDPAPTEVTVTPAVPYVSSRTHWLPDSCKPVQDQHFPEQPAVAPFRGDECGNLDNPADRYDLGVTDPRDDTFHAGDVTADIYNACPPPSTAAACVHVFGG